MKTPDETKTDCFLPPKLRTKLIKKLTLGNDQDREHFVNRIDALIPAFISGRKEGLKSRWETRKDAKRDLKKLEKKSQELQKLISQQNPDRSKPALNDALGFMSLPDNFLDSLDQNLAQFHEAVRVASGFVRSGPMGPKPHYYDQNFIYQVWSEYTIIFRIEPSTAKKSTFTNFITELFRAILPDDEHPGDLGHVATSAVTRWKERAQYL